MKKAVVFYCVVVLILGLRFVTAFDPPKVEAVPSYARQTGLACSGCHYAPTPRRFCGYVRKWRDY